MSTRPIPPESTSSSTSSMPTKTDTSSIVYTKEASIAPTIAAPAPEVPKSVMPAPIAAVAPIQAAGGQGFLMPQFQVDPNGSPEAQLVVQRGLNGESAVRGSFLY